MYITAHFSLYSIYGCFSLHILYYSVHTCVFHSRWCTNVRIAAQLINQTFRACCYTLESPRSARCGASSARCRASSSASRRPVKASRLRQRRTSQRKAIPSGTHPTSAALPVSGHTDMNAGIHRGRCIRIESIATCHDD